MPFKKLALIIVSHVVIAFVGFAIGIYSLPLLTAPASPSNEALVKQVIALRLPPILLKI